MPPFRPFGSLSFSGTVLLAIVLVAACTERRDPTGTDPRAPGSSFDVIPLRYVQVRAGFHSTCGLTAHGSISCWGGGGWGEERAPVEDGFTGVAANRLFLGVACGVKIDGTIACWGSNEFGQAPGRAFSPGSPFVAITTSGYHSCALRRDGRIRCWGDDTYGNVSEAPTDAGYTQVSANAFDSCALRQEGTIVCWGELSEPDPPASDLFVQVSTGSYHACGLRGDGGIECWGSNVFGQLDVPPGRYMDVDAGQYHVCAVRRNGALVCWGQPNESGRPPGGRGFVQVTTGGHHNCALRRSGAIACWGAPEYSAPRKRGTIFAFSGFLGAVENTPAWNTMKAGDAVAIAFSLGSNEGMQVIAHGYPQIARVSCATPRNAAFGAPIKDAGQTLLRYDARADRYFIRWSTERSWAGSCRQLVLKLVDGTLHRANFSFD